MIFRHEGTQSLNQSVRKEMAECLRGEKSVEEGMKACPGACTCACAVECRNDPRETRKRLERGWVRIRGFRGLSSTEEFA